MKMKLRKFIDVVEVFKVEKGMINVLTHDIDVQRWDHPFNSPLLFLKIVKYKI
jgi:hypothetical protein